MDEMEGMDFFSPFVNSKCETSLRIKLHEKEKKERNTKEKWILYVNICFGLVSPFHVLTG